MGVNIPKSVKDQLLGWRLALRGARYVEPDQMHVTLAFLDEQPMNVYREVCDLLEDLEFAPFELRFQSADFFGSKSTPRTLWADVRPSPELTTLQKKGLETLPSARNQDRVAQISSAPYFGTFKKHIFRRSCAFTRGALSGANRSVLDRFVSALFKQIASGWSGLPRRTSFFSREVHLVSLRSQQDAFAGNHKEKRLYARIPNLPVVRDAAPHSPGVQ